MKTKTCNCCGLPKKISDFGRDKRNKSGLQGMSNECKGRRRREKYKNNKTYRESQKSRQKKYNGYANEKAKKHIKEFGDIYVIASLKRGTGLTTEDIREHPILIETKRMELIIKRILKQSNNGGKKN